MEHGRQFLRSEYRLGGWILRLAFPVHFLALYRQIRRHYLKISVRGSNSESKDFLFSKIVHTACEAQLPFYSLGIGVTSLGVKWPGQN
jgi:hypothetical protein